MKTGFGLNGFVWWEGVVEDNTDPLAIGRCRVRCIGWDSGNKGDVPTGDLPWAYPMLPLNSPSKIFGLKPGTRVLGFFRDGEEAQDRVMLGAINTGRNDTQGKAGDFSAMSMVSTAIAIAGPLTAAVPIAAAVTADIPVLGALTEQVAAGVAFVEEQVDIVVGFVEEAVSAVVDPIVGAIEGALQEVAGAIEEALDPIVGAVTDATGEFLDDAYNFVEPLTTTVGGWGDSASTWFEEGAEKASIFVEVEIVTPAADFVEGLITPDLDASEFDTSDYSDYWNV